jgi:hypothetical protein
MGIEPLWALAGVLVGGVVTGGIEILKGRLSRRAQDRERAISRAEDAVEICESLLSWIGQTLEIAKTGKLVNDDPARFYRLAAIAQAWVPELLPHTQELHKSLYELMNAANSHIAVPIRDHVPGRPSAQDMQAFSAATTDATLKTSRAAKAAVAALERICDT